MLSKCHYVMAKRLLSIKRNSPNKYFYLFPINSFSVVERLELEASDSLCLKDSAEPSHSWALTTFNNLYQYIAVANTGILMFVSKGTLSRNIYLYLQLKLNAIRIQWFVKKKKKI